MRRSELLARTRRKIFGHQRKARRIDRIVRAERSRADLGLHLGCGSTRIEGLVNADAFDDSARDLALDAISLTGFDDDSVDLIETHHLFEHFTFQEGRTALCEWRRVLRPGGILMMTMPDLDRVIALWRRSSHQDRYLRSNSPIASMIWGSQEHAGMLHRSGYTKERIRELVSHAGFNIELTHSPYPLRPTPSMIIIATAI